jgi:DNA invertase Pin-like site-specific DNA recombinase
VRTPVVIYAAKSTQDVNRSIDTQLEDCHRLAAAEDWEVVAAFSDENFSAYSGNRGDDLQEAKRLAAATAAERGCVCMLLAQASDRFARGEGDRPGAADALIEIWHSLRRQNVHLRSVEDDGDLRDSPSVANLGHRAMMESRRKSGSVRKGNARRVEKGLPVGQRALALNPVKDGYEIIHPEVPTVVRIFTELFAGRAQLRIAANLEAEGVPTARGGKWYQGTIGKIARNPIYKGCVVHRGKVLPGKHPPLVPAPLWDGVNAMLDRKARTKGKGRGRRPKGRHLFHKGMLRCVCGEPLIPRTIPNRASAPYEVYLCYGRVRDVVACPVTPFRRDAIDSAIYHYFEQVGLDIEATRRQLSEAHDSKLTEVTAYHQRAQADRRTVEDRLARVRRDYLEGKIEAEDWAAFKSDLEADLDGATAKADRLAAQLADVEMSSAFTDLEAQTLERLAAIRRTIAGEVNEEGGDGVDLDAVRAALLRMFDGFQVRRVGPGMRMHAELAWQGDFVIDPIVKEESIEGRSPVRPILRREPIYTGGGTNNASASRSATRSCGRGSPPSCAAATAATTARCGSGRC